MGQLRRIKVTVDVETGDVDSSDYDAAADTKVRYVPQLECWIACEWRSDATVVHGLPKKPKKVGGVK